jgi:hypothetical protein
MAGDSLPHRFPPRLRESPPAGRVTRSRRCPVDWCTNRTSRAPPPSRR